MRKLFLFLALIVGLLASASTLQAQTANMSRYITLTVADGAAIKLDFMAAAAATPVRIVSGSNTQDITVGTGWYNSSFTSTFTVTAGSTTMTIYGDLTGFSCPKNGANLTAIDLSHNTELEELYCIGNQLTTLDVSHNRWLYKLYCSANRLTTLDVSYNTKLKKLNCSGNNFSSQALDDIYCSLPDRTGNTWGLIYPLNHESDPNHATVLATNKQNATAKNWNVRYFIDDTDIPPTTGTYTCPQLNISRYITLTVTNGAPIKLDFKAATNLTPIRIVNGSNTEDIIVGTSWYGTAPYTAGITTMTIHGDLTGFDCSGNGADLTAIDPSNNTQLEILYCKNNSINRLDVSQNTQLRGLYCSGNNLTSLDVSQNTKLIGLGCRNNGLSSLDVSHNTQLTLLDCSYNQLSGLDVSNNIQLENLYCHSNSLSSLDISQNTQLKKLSCHVNDFTTATLDRIYCALPVRSASDGAQIFPLGESSSAAEQNKVASTNGANAIAKNWRVLKYKTDGTHTDIATTGSYVCSGGGGTTTYDLKIAGVDVTSANCSDLSVISGVSGTVKYDPTTKVLTLDGATIQKTDNTVAIESSIDGLTIKVIGTSNLTTSSVALSFRKPLTITGGGVLNANSGTTCAIYVNKINLTIDGCTVNAKGKWGIAGNDGSSETLTIKNSTVTAEGVTDGSIADFASLTLDGCAITQPAGAAFDASLHAVALGGAKVKSKVTISPVTTYDLRIAGVLVTSANCSDLSVIPDVSGTVKYDPSTKTLTLQNATIQINTTNAIESSIDGLTINVIGTNNLTTGSSSTLNFRKPLTITGGGVLNANSGDNPAVFANGTNLTIDGCTVNAKGKWGITGNDGSSETLTIKNSTITAEGVTDGSIADFASLTLDGCAITQPVGAAFDASLHAVALGGAVVKSKVVISPTGGGKPNMSRYITLTVKSGENIRLDLKAATEGTPVRIVSGSNTQNIRVGTSWYGFANYTADGTEIKVYGDITNFDCQYNGANLTALDVSHNTQLTELWCHSNLLSSLDISKNTQLNELYCWDNKFSTQALDDIYCALPVRSASDNAKIVPVESASAPNHATVLATNAQNATAKNWKVLYAEDNADVPTTGKHKCSATDIADATAEQALTLYPNPVADVLYLSATARTIHVYDIYGTEVAHAADTDRVEVSHLPAGIYTVRADGTVAKMVKR